MVKWIKLTQNQYLGFFTFGLILLILQELPYLLMSFVRMESNPLMTMQDKSALLNVIEKTLGVSCIFVMLFIVRDDEKELSFSKRKKKVFFSAAMAALAIYYAGWIVYFSGIQNLPLILCVLVAMPPVYYALIGLWRENYALFVLGGLFLLAHISNVWNNLR